MRSGSSACQADSAARVGRRKRREKIVDASDIRLLLLHFLRQRPAHGYELIKAIEELSKGEYTPSPGIIYPNLTLLEEMECIAVVDPLAERKAYRLEAAGQAQLAQHQPAVTAIVQRLSTLAVLVNNRSLPDVERAIHNMKTALNVRLSQDGLSQQTLFAIIDALDEAAKKIERS
ncbi:PadR family transcriptional regulator [Erwinia persicina]|uniref:Transcriptional regulator n=1 Tax=Erwinia persicina TaxID=55211 RepID=A0A4V5U996_9GAMM|nr:PadR family transcriptional regulator [Erwinia persicina]MBD8105543.1 PadR family transcriptional regulator [Erwinia persicina]MBD8209691.1 PadR family transcriptional regulator [Erwinia persicina]TKJ89317.1 transcriptional regulator [Erwinia persicina]